MNESCKGAEWVSQWLYHVMNGGSTWALGFYSLIKQIQGFSRILTSLNLTPKHVILKSGEKIKEIEKAAP